MSAIRGQVTGVVKGGLYVTIPVYGDAEFGPLEAVSDGSVTKPYYKVGDRVLLEQVGRIKEDLVVIGWATQVSDTPPSYPVGPHRHQIQDVDDLPEELGKRSLTTHTHNISGVTGLQSALDGKSPTGHAHSISDISNLRNELNGKASASHTHRIQEVTGLQDTLDTKSDLGHRHVPSDVPGAGFVPVGGIIPYAGTSDPAGWMICDGRTLSRTAYPELFAVVGNPASSTTFRLPDLRGRMVRGLEAGQASGAVGGSDTVNLTVSQLPPHTHNITVDSGGSHTHPAFTSTAGAHTHTGSANSAGTHTHTVTVSTDGVHYHNLLLYGNTGNDQTGGRFPYGGDGGAINEGAVTTTPDRIQSAGAHSHTVTLGDGGAHTHTLTVNSGGGHTHSVTVSSGGAHDHTASASSTGDGAGIDIRNPFMALNYIIKT